MTSQEDKNTCKIDAIDAAQASRTPDDQWVARKPAALVSVIAAGLFGGGGMLTWLAFLLVGPLRPLPLGLGTSAKLSVDALLCLLFFVQHSIMVRGRFRLWLTRFVRADFHGALYAAASGACLLMLVGFWQPVAPAIWQPPDPIRWAMFGVFLTAGIGAWWGSRSLGEFDALGITPAMQVFRQGPSAGPLAFTIRGPYRWVRHPLYLFSMVIIWTGPVFTWDRLLHNTLWTIWIVVGATMEESDLVECFGDAYRSYRQRVPMLLPRSLKPLVPED